MFLIEEVQIQILKNISISHLVIRILYCTKNVLLNKAINNKIMIIVNTKYVVDLFAL